MALVLGATFAALATGCAETGEYVWFHSLPPETTRSAEDYVIGSGDQLSIRVLGHDDMTVHQRVRGDGKIAMFLIGELDARGKKPGGLKAELEGRLKEFIVAPSVIVNVDEAQPTAVVILGEVAKPGALQLDQDTRLSRALAMVGGLTEFASRSGIYVVSHAPAHTRVRFQYKDILRNAGGAGDFPLHQGDLVEVE
jgi:polysaccharide export outer membrane protein